MKICTGPIEIFIGPIEIGVSVRKCTQNKYTYQGKYCFGRKGEMGSGSNKLHDNCSKLASFSIEIILSETMTAV